MDQNSLHKLLDSSTLSDYQKAELVRSYVMSQRIYKLLSAIEGVWSKFSAMVRYTVLSNAPLLRTKNG